MKSQPRSRRPADRMANSYSLMFHPPFDSPPDAWLGDAPTRDEARHLLEFLTGQGTFRFPTVSTGLFSAAAAENPEFRLTGYQNIWTRDNCHIAHALWLIGDVAAARRAVESLLTFYEKHQRKFADVIAGKVDPAEPMHRPHIRFDGEQLAELDVQWAHAQNDALGVTLWLACKLMRSGDVDATPGRMRLCQLFVDYFAAIRYWNDEDSGHWEETRKIEASSIGAVVAGLRELRLLAVEQPSEVVRIETIDSLLAEGQRALREILPAECIQPDPKQNRRYDAALLFLIYPLEVVDEPMADRIIADIREHLTGPIGIRRYNGDSYWCANYRDLLSPEVRTTDFSEDMSARDALLQPGEEAQWCVFDPILSIIHARRFLLTRDRREQQLQHHHLRRSLAQLTTAESRFPPFRCPESYFLEHGEWIPNDITPLLWTQANLRMALEWLGKTAE